jgi:hypothetical protein
MRFPHSAQDRRKRQWIQGGAFGQPRRAATHDDAVATVNLLQILRHLPGTSGMVSARHGGGCLWPDRGRAWGPRVAGGLLEGMASDTGLIQ